MQISHTKLCTLYMHRKINLRTTAEILNITISAVFWPPRDGPCTFFTYLLLQIPCSRASMDILFVGWFCDRTVEVCVRGDEFAFTLVPYIKNFSRRGTSQNTRVNKACETYTGNVA
jgi:hypothetical protein